MRKTSIVLAVIFAFLGVLFAILPMGTLALLPVIFAIVFGVIAFITSDSSHKNSPKWILIIAILTLIIVVGKETLIPDVVAKDPKFEQKKIESKKEDLKDLEGLE